jgi:rRNA maturation RNase YbeY
MPVLVSTRGCRAPTLARRLGRSARRLLAALRRPDDELSVLLVSDREMRRLNRSWRGRDRPTDVLSFPQADGEDPAPHGLLGDVVISVDTARRQAAEREVAVGHEADRLLVHGVLHLLGYDHETSAREERRMRRREAALARALEER